ESVYLAPRARGYLSFGRSPCGNRHSFVTVRVTGPDASDLAVYGDCKGECAVVGSGAIQDIGHDMYVMEMMSSLGISTEWAGYPMGDLGQESKFVCYDGGGFYRGKIRATALAFASLLNYVYLDSFENNGSLWGPLKVL
ncbi:unnamed protein product, partial [Symbiodinium sp. CCMP2456]